MSPGMHGANNRQHNGRCSHVHEQSTIQISLKIGLDVMHVRLSGWRCYTYQYTKTLTHMHIRLPGSGLHIPLDIQVAVILAVGTNIGLHMNEISAPSVVFWYGSIEPSVKGVGSLQLTGGRKKFTSNNRLCSNLWWADIVCKRKPVYMHVYG